MIDADQLKEVIQAICQTHWDIDYTEFRQRAGFVDDDYARDKWGEWLKLAGSLRHFNPDTLARIVGVTPPAKGS